MDFDYKHNYKIYFRINLKTSICKMNTLNNTTIDWSNPNVLDQIMKDIIEYRTMEYYRRRYVEK